MTDDLRFAICDCPIRTLPLFALVLVLYGCSSPYDIRLSDDRSASCGELFFFGWSDPPLIPGTRLADSPSGSRVVLWNEAGLEAIVDLGDPCAVLVRDGDGARAPTDLELQVIAAVFPDWPLAASPRIADYAGERRLERRFPSHIRSHVENLGPAEVVTFALGDEPAGWMSLGGRVFALSRAAEKAPAADFDRLIDRIVQLRPEQEVHVLRALVARPEASPAHLVRMARAGIPIPAARHPKADESVGLAAVEEIAKEPLSSRRRAGLESLIDSPGLTPAVRARILEVPLAYPEDREAIRAKAGVPK